MREGSVISGRFRLIARAGAGGMGEVFRADDLEAQRLVAIKILARDADAARFEREAKVLAALDHPAIVRYIAHGETADRERWIAMEWLEGRDLAARVEGEGLSLFAALTVVEQVVSALAAAHAQGIVHRDIKPNNIFLVGDRCDDVRLLDFGIARAHAATHALTKTGVLLGTPSFMAPEQIRAHDAVDHRADLYAIGCVLFQCVTGRAPFEADNIMALLAKVVLEEAPSARQLRAEVSPTIDALIASLLDKEPARRPASAQALLEACRRARAEGDLPSPSRAGLALDAADKRTSALSTGEQRVLCVVLATDPEDAADRALSSEEALTIAASPAAPIEAAIRAIHAPASSAQARVERIGERNILCAIGGASTERAARAALIALTLRDALPTHSVVIATGRGALDTLGTLGAVIDRASTLARATPGGRIAIDATTAALVDERFVVRDGALVEQRAIDGDEQPSLLLGKRIAFVGRERELALLRSTLDEAIDDQVARAVIVVGPPGSGKSRVRRELLRLARQRPDAPHVWQSRSDPLEQDAPLSTLRSLVRAQIQAAMRARGDGAGDAAIAAAIQSMGVVARREVAFVAELAGLGLEAAFDPSLAAARSEPATMALLLREAFESLIRAATSDGRTLLVLIEDAQWADDASLRWMDQALGSCAERAVFVCAFARPPLLDRAPRLWSERGATELRLTPLARRACERLVLDALGAEATETQIARLIDRAGGNPFVLEELIRAEREGLDVVPESVLALAQARLDALGLEERRTLRAAAVFGEAFWLGGVLALLGESAVESAVSARLEALCQRELLKRSTAPRFAGEREFRFQHGLLRDAAYTMLTDADRALGHRLAAEWLVRVDERESLRLAEHFERGGSPERAIDYVAAEIDRALSALDLSGAAALLARATQLATAIDPIRVETRARLARVRAELSHANKDLRGAYSEAMTVIELTDPRSLDWAKAATQLAVLASRFAEHATIERLEAAVLAQRDAHPLVDRVRALLARHRYIADEVTVGDALVASLSHDDARLEAQDAGAAALVHGALVHRNRGREQRWRRLQHAREALRCARVACDLVLEAYALGTLATVQADAGHWDDCERTVRDELLARPERVALPGMMAATTVVAARVAAARGRYDEAATEMQRALEFFAFTQDQRRVVYTSALLAEVLWRSADSADAEALFAQGALDFDAVPMMRPWFDLQKARWLIERGDAAGGLALARRALDDEMASVFVQVELGAQAAIARALDALREVELATEARAALRQRAQRALEELPDEADRAKSRAGLAEFRALDDLQ